MRFVFVGLCTLLFAAVINPSPVRATASCEDLTSLKLPNATITLARAVGAGAFTPTLPEANAAPQAGAGRPLNASQAFCRVVATLRPSNESDIKIELWLPSVNWNRKFQAVGNGGFSGTIAYPAMVAALDRGYAAGSTDTGHVGASASFALGHPEAVIDFGWRAVHEMTVASKAIIASYYDAGPKYSYWNGCSAGGRQGMKEAQQFPMDFDGIIAGSPGIDWTGRAAQAVRVTQALQKNEAARLSAAKAQLVHTAVLNACDSLDGVKDGLISDPKRCAFDPGVLQCQGAEDASCLTPAQVATARLLYTAGVNPKTKREIGGLQPGSELQWTQTGWSPAAQATGLDQFRFLVFQDPGWDVDKFNFEADIVRADETDHGTLNALDPNLKPFIDHGGKLIHYHGWSDPQISPMNSVQYYNSVVQAVGDVDRVRGSYRLFMAPGMAHCGGGEGPNTFDMLGALEQWVEQGNAPDRIIASHSSKGVVDRTRPLCPYPEVATYVGLGSTDEATNFVCKRPPGLNN